MRALSPRQSLILDSGSPLHSNQIKYSHIHIAEELPELFEVQDCYLPYLLLHSVVCVGLSGELMLILIFCIQFFILMFLDAYIFVFALYLLYSFFYFITYLDICGHQ